MAFMGIFLSGLLLFAIVVGVLVTSAILFLIISIIMKHRYKKKLSAMQEGDKKPKKWYLIPRVLFILNVAPLVYMAVMFVASVIHTYVEDRNSLANNVMEGNYQRVEKLLEKGVDPDCTLRSNEPAADGVQTLLSEMCENYGFTDSYDDPVDREVTAEELAMMELLIKYGADVNAVSYKHDRNNSRHTVEDEYSFYNTDDICGYTPLMYAVRCGSTEIVQLLIKNGANVNARDFCGYTPAAIVADNLEDVPGEEILRLLIENGAYTDVENNFGQTPEYLAKRFASGAKVIDNYGIKKLIDENK